MTRMSLLLALLAVPAFGNQAVAQAVVRSGDGASVSVKARTPAQIDYASARPAPQPRLFVAPRPPSEQPAARKQRSDTAATPTFKPGGEGDGREDPIRLPVADEPPQSEAPSPPPPPEFGSSGQAYTTSLQPSPKADPQRRAGKLFIKDGGATFFCSASLIDRGVIVTAAHCVAAFGERRFFDSWRFVPAYDRGAAPFGTWDAAQAYVPTSYYDGTARCEVTGVTCVNDVAILVAKAKKGALPGQRVGWFGYGANGFGFTSGGEALITQLGYPSALNRGERMIRTDSQGSTDFFLADNTVIGSLQTGGSSGGPWLINFGDAVSLSGGVKRGSSASRNVVVGVTSWGYDGANGKIKQQGASPFGADLRVLVKDACKAYPRACE